MFETAVARKCDSWQTNSNWFEDTLAKIPPGDIQRVHDERKLTKFRTSSFKKAELEDETKLVQLLLPVIEQPSQKMAR